MSSTRTRSYCIDTAAGCRLRRRRTCAPGLTKVCKFPPTHLTKPHDILADVTRATDENFRVTKKQIPRLCSYVDVKRHDLYLPEEKEQYSNLPNFDSSLASVKIPSQAYWSRLFLGSYDNLYIVSTETTPNSSIASGDSKRSSPTSTWGQSSEEDARSGAATESQESQ